jgi:putative ABC transport system permease protein
MILRESVGIALGAIRANKLRSFLTLLGTIIGVAAVIAVLSFVEGLNRYVSEKLLAAGSNVFWVDKYGIITSQEAWEDAMKRRDITPEDADVLREGVPHATMVVAMASGNTNVRFEQKIVRSIELRGRSAGFESVDDITVVAGRAFNETDDLRRRLVCVIAPEVADELFDRKDPIGQTVRVGSQSYEVLGMTERKGSVLGQNQDRYVWVPIRTFLKHHTDRRNVDLAIKSESQAALPLAQQEARNILRARRHLRPGQADDFSITTSDNVMDLYRNLTGGIFVVTIGVASIALLVGGIVIMNIMLVSVTERTREIGIRKALGARRRDVLSQFLVESTTLSLAGGLIGILLGTGIALLVGAISPLPAAVSMPAVIMGIAMSSIIGIFFGSYPAARAARLDPIEALRYE